MNAPSYFQWRMMEKTRRKEREFQLRRAEILEQAEKIFSAKGFHNTTVAEIASASGFAVGTLYHVFENKERLYTAMVIEKLDRMYAGIWEAASREADIVEQIEAIVAAQFRFVEENTAFCRIFIRGDHLSIPADGTTLRQRVLDNFARHVAFITGVMSEGIRTGLLKRRDPQMMAAALMGIINSCTFQRLAGLKGTPLDKKVPFVLDLFLDGGRKNAD
jgi:TetR/AcrR family transcriptional regulator